MLGLPNIATRGNIRPMLDIHKTVLRQRDNAMIELLAAPDDICALMKLAGWHAAVSALGAQADPAVDHYAERRQWLKDYERRKKKNSRCTRVGAGSISRAWRPGPPRCFARIAAHRKTIFL
jgi:hypothetical protein